ncbi:carbon-nitrogen hydrolase family protein [Porticoccus sp. W117]|uniref:carbon-nitrogen hydrolase family protein n=1 Tax=Porticoccus sp. W117 TaxID=3054777 RepID=UPI0025973B21|nr:carbon-nitrogen hydrolase family protein [Porticoccus sp. W117]MDM3871735.1 carbon-nitrogen hydrolase family protein [Porticoccus sp. W117]
MTKVAAIQMCSTRDLQHNLQRAEALLAEASGQGAQLAVLPENFAYYGCKELRQAACDEADATGPVRQFLSEQAKRHNMWIVGGTVPVAESGDERGYAACLVVDSEGEERAQYHKIHLFDVDVGDAHKHYRESDDYRPGIEPMVLDTPFGKLGLSVCYDLRFAEMYRELADRGAEIVVVPSAFTAVTGEAHWQLLLRARAVENQCFVIGANMGDRDHPKRPTWGGSVIVHPWGDVLAEMDGGEGVIFAELDLGEIQRLKKNMPIAQHRRL